MTNWHLRFLLVKHFTCKVCEGRSSCTNGQAPKLIQELGHLDGPKCNYQSGVIMIHVNTSKIHKGFWISTSLTDWGLCISVYHTSTDQAPTATAGSKAQGNHHDQFHCAEAVRVANGAIHCSGVGEHTEIHWQADKHKKKMDFKFQGATSAVRTANFESERYRLCNECVWFSSKYLIGVSGGISGVNPLDQKLGE